MEFMEREVVWTPEYEGSLADWVRDTPDKTVLNIAFRSDLTDEDFVHLKGVGLKHLDMTECLGITDAGFANIEGLETLVMRSCEQDEITNAAFVHLSGIKTLDMSDCKQSTITDAAFANLGSVQYLTINRCNQEGITDAAFKGLKRVKKLSMMNCIQSGITDAAFAGLNEIKNLNISDCTQFTNAAISGLTGIDTLNISHCTQFTNDAIKGLTRIKDLNISHCTQPELTADAFTTIGKTIKQLDISGCTQLNITQTMMYVRGLHQLAMKGCTQESFNDDSLLGLKNLLYLNIAGCTQETITPKVFRQPGNLMHVIMSGCRQDSFDDKTFHGLERLDSVVIIDCKPIVYKGIAVHTWEALKRITAGTKIEGEKDEICGYIATISKHRPDIKIISDASMCRGYVPPVPRYAPANDDTRRLANWGEVSLIETVAFSMPKAPIPKYEMPSTIRDAIHGDMPLGAYMVKMSGDCIVFKIGETYVGVQKSYMLKEMLEGEATFYECTGLFDKKFTLNDIYDVPYFGIRSPLGVFYVLYAQMVDLLSSPWSFWELTKAGTLKFTASRLGVRAGEPVSNIDHCQDGTTKTVHDSQAITFKTEEEEEEEVPNIITLKYGEQKKEIPYDEVMTIGAIREKAKELFSIPDVKLVYTGRILDDDAKTVKSANIQKGFAVQVQKVGGKRKTKRGLGRGKKTYRRKV